MTCALNLALYNKHMLTSLDWSNTLPSEKLFSLCSVIKSVAYPSVKTMKYLEKLFNPLELTGFGKKKVSRCFRHLSYYTNLLKNRAKTDPLAGSSNLTVLCLHAILLTRNQ